MTTATTTAPTTAPARRGLGTLTATEARLFLRDPGAVFFALAFPTVLLLGMGLVIPGMREPITDMPQFAGMAVIHLWGPAVLSLAVGTVALTTLPAYVASYREHGVFRRLSTTPMRPRSVLAAHVVVSGAALAAAVVLAVTVGVLALDLPLPEQPLLIVGTLVLATLAMFAIGFVVGGTAPKASTASGIGMLLYFPMLFFAGVWTPTAMMPDTLATIASFVPLGAASEAMTVAWFGGDLPWQELAVLAGWSVVGYPVAARVFRWS
ncbi:ABC transporter permease [uncultured Georgenia sp.]|uniref:ABC transporter permease n=1 Tax=uncultured Georgenia sp. TaxID=378209 RepID=UPI0026397DD0|nr:ABC transporter permease [uncultured Georgenia sp.]HLV03060.1 ABC transporter permease [Actinomycetaceae bacterium]